MDNWSITWLITQFKYQTLELPTLIALKSLITKHITSYSGSELVLIVSDNISTPIIG